MVSTPRTSAGSCSAARRVAAEVGVDVRTTLLAAHAVPSEFDGRADDYIDLVCGEIIPAAARGLADAVDAFCETIGFTAAQTRRVFAAARAHGLPVKLHADQLSDAGGAALAAEFGALSADHLEYTSDAGVAAMARAGTVAVLLPGAFYALARDAAAADRRAARASACRSRSRPTAIPAPRRSTSLPLMLNMACTLFRLTPGGGAGRRHAARGARAWAAPTAARSRWASAPTSRSGTSRCRRSCATGSAAIAASRHRARGPHRALGGANDALRDLERGDSPLVIDVPHAGTYRARGDCGAAHARRARVSRHRLACREAVRVRAR